MIFAEASLDVKDFLDAMKTPVQIWAEEEKLFSGPEMQHGTPQ